MLSTVGEELIGKGRGRYGDPCGAPSWEQTTNSCKSQGSNLATKVLGNYDIPIRGNAPSNQYSSCCPLDIVNQDPFACIRMSLMAKLIDGEYWECYADEFGFARFQKILEKSSPSNDIFVPKNVQYCLPSVQTASMVDMVIVRAAKPPPFRQCGDWMDIIDGSKGSIVEIADLSELFRPNPKIGTISTGFASGARGTSNSALPQLGTKFTWGQVSSRGSNSGDDPTCSHGIFSQHGGIIYPDYERKQSYKDGINDVFEVGPHMNIIFWLTDIEFGSTDPHFMRHYNVQFVKSCEFPVLLEVNPTSSVSPYWGPACHEGPGSTPNIMIDLTTTDSTTETCTSPVVASTEGRSQPNVQWTSYTTPSFFGYANAKSRINFSDVSKWDIGSNICMDNQIDNMYESTSTLMGNGANLIGWEHANTKWWGYTPGTSRLYIGMQTGTQTFDISNQNYIEVPTDSPVSDGILYYAIRAQAPHSGTFCSMPFTTTAVGLSVSTRQTGLGSDQTVCWGDGVEWSNIYWPYMLTGVSHSWASGLASMKNYLNYNWLVNKMKLPRPGLLMGVGGDNLFTVDTWWAKVNVARPGMIVQGKGADAEDFIESVSMRVAPVYIVDLPAPVAAHGNTDFSKVVNPDTDVWDSMYCTVERNISDTEELQLAETGNTFEISLPFLFPSYAAQGGSSGLRAEFDQIGNECYSIAKNIFGYLNSFRYEPNKSMSYVCGPPRSQSEVPGLGQTVNTPHGLRTINSISYQYTDSSSFTMTIEVGPVNINNASAGGLRSKVHKPEQAKGRVVAHDYGSLFHVLVEGVGRIKAWNQSAWPWEVGDRVDVELYNNPVEL
jgi:hypothetical protein